MAAIWAIVSPFLTFLGQFVTGSGGAAVGELGLALVSWFIQRSQNNADAHARFLDLVQNFESMGSFGGRLRAKYAAQSQKLDDAIDAELAKEQAAKDAAAKAEAAPVPPAKQ